MQNKLLYKVWHYIVQILVVSLLDFALTGILIFSFHGFDLISIDPDMPGVFWTLFFTFVSAMVIVGVVNLQLWNQIVGHSIIYIDLSFNVGRIFIGSSGVDGDAHF